MKPRRLVVPDVHGCVKTLRRLLEETVRLERMDTVYLLGDLIDRGPDPKGVLDYVLLLRNKGYRPVALRGNHEQMLLDACHDRSDFRLWLMNGGTTTLESFGVEDACEIPLSYRHFLDNLPYYLILPDVVLVHAGINCAESEPFSDYTAMLWSRDPAVDRQKLGGRRLICGHTACRRDEALTSLAGDRVTLDNGCVYVGRTGMGCLTALDLDAGTIVFQENCDLS